MFLITLWSDRAKPNGRNWPGVARIYENHPVRAAIWAQEAYEATYKLNPINLVKSLTTDGKREMEFMGHEIEVQAAWLAYRKSLTEYRRKEAGEMISGYPKLFGDMTVEQVMGEMEKRSVAAARWVNDHRVEILGAKAK